MPKLTENDLQWAKEVSEAYQKSGNTCAIFTGDFINNVVREVQAWRALFPSFEFSPETGDVEPIEEPDAKEVKNDEADSE